MSEEKKDIKVEYSFLSKTCGLKVSNLCLGAMTFGNNEGSVLPGCCDEDLSHQILDGFVAAGGNFIDTANIYSRGLSETYIGTWFQKRQNRDSIVLATKCRFGSNKEDPNGTGLSRKTILKSVEDSLKRLQTEYIDLYQIHCWDDATPLKETLMTLNDLVRSGKVRYVGGSNLKGWQLQKILDMNHYMGFNQWVSLQQQYNLLCRGSEPESFEVCKREGLGVLPWSPLKSGLLTDKVKRDEDLPEGSRVSVMKGMSGLHGIQPVLDNEKYWELLDKMGKVAEQQGKTKAQVALRWLLQTEPVTSVIIGAKTLDQLNSNLEAGTGWKLTEEQMEILQEASSKLPGGSLNYPYDMVNAANKDRSRGLYAQF